MNTNDLIKEAAEVCYPQIYFTPIQTEKEQGQYITFITINLSENDR